MDLAHRIKRSFKPRFAVVYPFGLFIFIFGSCDDHSIRAGIGYIIAGLLVRLWSNGYAIKNDKLTTSGPYAFVRNPLYLGTFLIAIGFVIVLMTMNLYMLAVGAGFLGALIFMYTKTIQSEQKMLTEKFGDAYLKYVSRVPAMIPTLVPYTEGEKWPFSLQRLIFSKEHKSVVWMTVLLIFFHLKSRLYIEHKPMTEKTLGLIALGFFFIALDIAYELNKKRLHHRP